MEIIEQIKHASLVSLCLYAIGVAFVIRICYEIITDK